MKILYTFLGLILAMSISAQDAFHRTYPFNSQDSVQFITDGIQLADDGYATIGREWLADGLINQSYATTVSRYDVKGSLVYSKDIYLADSSYINGGGKIVQMDNGNLAFTTAIAGDNQGVAVVVMDQLTTEPIWSKRMLNEFVSRPQIDNYPNGHLLVSSNNTVAESSIFMSLMTEEGGEVWSNLYKTMEADIQYRLSDTYVSEIDSSIFFTGASLANGNNYLSKLDENGDLLWSNSYSSNSMGISFVPNGIVEMPDSSIYVSGSYTLVVDGLVNRHQWITKHDKNGSIIWSKGLSDSMFFTEGMGLSVKGENLVMAAQSDPDNIDPNFPSFPIIVELDTSGVLVASQSYMIANNSSGGPIHTTSDDGVVLFNTSNSLDGIMADIIKTRPDLSTNCSETVDIILEDLELSQSAVVWTSVEIMDSDSIETDITSILNLYDIPTISPSADQWCPNELIIDTLDATPSPLPDGVITYEWMGPGVDGNINPFVVGMEEGEYTVMVTINDNHCYTLCDTVNISRLPEPQANIAIDFSQFCIDNSINLIGDINGVQPLESVVWSTNESTPIIKVESEGIYSLTIVDACMETAMATAEVIFPEQLMSLEVSSVIGEDCENFAAVLTANTNVNDDINTSFMWTNEDGVEIGAGRIIEVNEPGTYTVKVDNCTESLTVDESIVLLEESSSLQWPKVFFPRGEEEVNRTFGPVNPCGATISNYTLKIYNRWGNEVFTSDNFNEEWNGQHGGSDSASAVYVYVAEYLLNEEAKIDKGDVTLLR